ncbi:uncharacterized protein LOC136072813 isoform X1 [Hydra vulgaris]|uniref:uncharacterized protein LOC136072813 isoform X1 n=1 Tax=Hydra vulgaris TaxID=6087 RepID=UPI0032EA1407
MKLHQVDLYSNLFKNDASFIIRPNKYYPGYVSLESTNYPGYFLRHQGFTVKLQKEQPQEEFYRRDASFRIVQLGISYIGQQYLLQCNNYLRYRIGVRSNDTAAIILNSLDQFRVVKALNGREDSVSLQSVINGLKYQNFILKLNQVDLFSELLKMMLLLLCVKSITTQTTFLLSPQIILDIFKTSP